jgi:hypothetical protein
MAEGDEMSSLYYDNKKAKKKAYHGRIRAENTAYLKVLWKDDPTKAPVGDMLYIRGKVKADFCMSTGRFKLASGNDWLGGGAAKFVNWYKDQK